MVRRILIRAGNVVIRARLLATPTADRIWDALPIRGSVQTWGKEVYFRTPISHDLEPDARAVVSKGEIAFWAVAIDDVDQLKGVYPGEEVSVVEADDNGQDLAVAAAGCRPRRSRRQTLHADDGGTVG